MASYYVNRNVQSNGDHEVHKEGCSYMPLSQNRLFLGNFYNCQPAVTEAKKHYPRSNGCFYCSPACHTT